MSDDYYDMASPDIYPILKDNSRKNRRNMTLAESVLWDCLRTDLSEFRFRRQHIIGDYIVDFVCLSKTIQQILNELHDVTLRIENELNNN